MKLDTMEAKEKAFDRIVMILEDYHRSGTLSEEYAIKLIEKEITQASEKTPR